MKTTELLRKLGVEYDVLQHKEACTAAGIVHTLKVQEQAVAKTVLIRANHGFKDVVAIVPADCRVDLPKLSRLLGRADVRIAVEEDISRRCPDCERGVLPPFGSQFGMETVVDAQLVRQGEIVFVGDTHHEVVRMQCADFLRIESPLTGDIATH